MKKMLEDVLAVIMAGGMGARLKPLTDVRAKPAVPFAGVHRIIDFTLSNCINSGVRKIFVLTQYKSHSLSNHLKTGWSFLSRRLNQYLDEIPAQMQSGHDWYKGTADAVRQNISFIEREQPSAVLILSGDHVYKMDYRLLRTYHDLRKSRITVAVSHVSKDQASAYGVVEVDKEGRVVGFEEKPTNPKTIPGTNTCLVSMGIYLFSYDALEEILESEWDDFGTDVFVKLVQRGDKIFAFDFTSKNAIQEYQYITRGGQRVKVLAERASDSDYWRDVGTIHSYWHAHLDVVSASPRFNLYGEKWPIFTSPQHFPPAKFVHEAPGRTGSAYSSIVSNGVIISGSLVRNSILCPGMYVHSHSLIENSILLGGSYAGGIVSETSIGRHCRIRNAIIDKRVTLTAETSIGYNREEDESRGLTTYSLPHSDDYIVVIPKGYAE